jgi:hypothetical protein
LDNFTQSFDLDTLEGQGNYTQYLAEWINSYAGNVYSRPTYSDMPTGQSVSLQVLVFNNLTNNGYAEEDIDWCISETKIYDQLNEDLPWIDWDINVTWAYLSDYPYYYNYIQNNYAVDVDGKYIEVSAGLFSILDSDLEDHFNLSKSDVVLPCYFFLTNEVSFKWGGTSFAGLGGMGWEILLGTQNSIFENGDINLKKRGMSDVMIHELGHSMGLPHPHGFTYGWGSSFVEDTMSYFALANGFSTFYIDAIGTGHTEVNYYYAQDEYETALQLYHDSNLTSIELTNIMVEINATLAAIPTYYSNMDYSSSASMAFYARDLIANMVDYIDNPTNNPPSTWQNWWTGAIIEGSVILFSIMIIVITVSRRRRV